MTSSTSYPVGMFPVPRDPLAYLPSPAAVLLDAPATLNLHLNDLAIPVTDIITQAKDYLKNELSVPIWNHSHRSYLFGSAIASLHLPGDSKYAFDPESLYLACLFHDIGCTEQNIKKTKMSFEFWGAFTARQWLLEHGASTDLADSVGEAIARHTDFNGGQISLNGSLIQLGTLFDNIHQHPHLIPAHLVTETHGAFPRLAWGGCFARAMELEVLAKPWAHATELRATEGQAWDKILTHPLEKQFE